MKLIFTLPLAAAQQASLIDNGCRPASQPPMIYGTAWKKEKTDKLVQLALKKGFRAIDTAGMPEHYDERLTGIGINAAIAEGNIPREDIWVQTKYTPQQEGAYGDKNPMIPYDMHASLPTQVKQSFTTSHQNLGILMKKWIIKKASKKK